MSGAADKENPAVGARGEGKVSVSSHADRFEAARQAFLREWRRQTVALHPDDARAEFLATVRAMRHILAMAGW